MFERLSRNARKMACDAGANRSGAGFSLLEVMIALSVLGVGILGMLAVQVTAMKLSGDSRIKTEAAFLAMQQVETFHAMSASAVTDLVGAVGYPNDPNNPIDPTPTDGNPETYNRRWLVQPNTPEAGVITVTVEVDWVNSLGLTRTVRLQTLKAGA